MRAIYEPRGRAREYSPLALDIYNGCDHCCSYCFVPILRKRFGQDFPINPRPRKGILEEVKQTAHKYSRDKQILLSFSGDPYCQADIEFAMTRKILKVLLKYQATIAILTKGRISLWDKDLFKLFEQIKVGATLTCDNEKDSLVWEPYAALPADRISTLKKLHENGIKTWVSFEPVIYPEQTLHLIDLTHEFVNHYKIGKMNYREMDIDWWMFGVAVIEKLNHYGKPFYIKNSLAPFIPKELMNAEQRDMDFLSLRGKKDASDKLSQTIC